MPKEKTILVDAVNTFIIKGQGISVEMQRLLDAYPNPKIILTNADDEQIVQFGLQNLPYPLFTLKHAPDKVDPAYFRTMLEHFHLTPDDVVYFEHNQQTFESAQSVGITSYHYDAEKKDLKSLQVFLDSRLK